ncbi:hypothetical protein [Hymenobacter guriensis]|uniref:DUF4815 domain-containing protein n=1 Tax=Hymenobacter guriensis TaxID=2793065 RepID=A0ABS0KYZ5_9BACT|nr:hypothetical protein [Hymenobacter guriensis]MBG8552362.1 hypothetical protein [Hymenobacter guriensis]
MDRKPTDLTLSLALQLNDLLVVHRPGALAPEDRDVVTSLQALRSFVGVTDTYLVRTWSQLDNTRQDAALKPGTLYRVSNRPGGPDVLAFGGSTISLLPDAYTVSGDEEEGETLTPVSYDLATDSVAARGGAVEVGTRTITATKTGLGITAGQELTINNDANGAAIEAIVAPELPPLPALSTPDALKREPGADLATELNWTVTKKDNLIATVTVAGESQDVGDGTTNLSGTVHVFANPISESNPTGVTTFKNVATDAEGLVKEAEVKVLIQSKRFWGALSSDPATISAGALSTALKAMTGTEATAKGWGQEFGETRQQARTITLASQYPVFAYKATAGTPTVKVGGLLNSAFQTRAFTFINSEGEPEGFLLVYGTLNSGTVSIELL